MSKITRDWVNTNGLGMIQLFMLGAIFYVSAVAGNSSRAEVEKHEATTDHPPIVSIVNRNATDIVLIKQRASLVNKQNIIDHKALFTAQKETNALIQKIAIKLQVEI
jgi:hypothetical protein